MPAARGNARLNHDPKQSSLACHGGALNVPPWAALSEGGLPEHGTILQRSVVCGKQASIVVSTAGEQLDCHCHWGAHAAQWCSSQLLPSG